LNRSARILVLGEALVDVFPDREVLGGAPYNVARNLAALGASPLFVSRVGAGSAGERIAAQMAALGMHVHGLQRDREHPTGRVEVELRKGQPHFTIQPGGAWEWLDAESAAACVRSARPALAYFGTLAQRSPASRAAVRGSLLVSPAMRVLDLNLRGVEHEREVAAVSLEMADFAKLNEDELRALLLWFMPQLVGDAEAPGALMSRFALPRMVVTRGEAGWSYFEAAGCRRLDGRSPQVSVVDTVGAGDAFAAVLMLGELRGWPIGTTLLRAAEFAARVCTLHGAFDPGSSIYADAQSRWAE
jgi:fructokinase